MSGQNLDEVGVRLEPEWNRRFLRVDNDGAQARTIRSIEPILSTDLVRCVGLTSYNQRVFESATLKVGSGPFVNSEDKYITNAHSFIPFIPSTENLYRLQTTDRYTTLQRTNDFHELRLRLSGGTTYVEHRP
jgi:hypothetical protein